MASALIKRTPISDPIPRGEVRIRVRRLTEYAINKAPPAGVYSRE